MSENGTQFTATPTGNVYSQVTPQIERLAKSAREADQIPQELYTKYNVKRGLRDLNGKGVLAGLTNVSEVRAKKIVDGEEVSDYGHLYYRGYEIEDLIHGFSSENRHGVEEPLYLFLYRLLLDRAHLTAFVRDIIL